MLDEDVDEESVPVDLSAAAGLSPVMPDDSVLSDVLVFFLVVVRLSVL